MTGRTCYHCKQWIEQGEEHDCWTTTEGALTADLSEDLRDAWERLRETAAEFGDQRIYASHSSIMFSRRSCYFFVRPKKTFLEVCIFLGRAVRSPLIRRVDRASKAKLYHILRVTHRDEVEAPFTDWLPDSMLLATADVLTAAAEAHQRWCRLSVAAWSYSSAIFTKPCWTSWIILAPASALTLIPGSRSSFPQWWILAVAPHSSTCKPRLMRPAISSL